MSRIDITLGEARVFSVVVRLLRRFGHVMRDHSVKVPIAVGGNLAIRTHNARSAANDYSNVAVAKDGKLDSLLDEAKLAFVEGVLASAVARDSLDFDGCGRHCCS